MRALVADVARKLTVTAAEHRALYAPRIGGLGYRVEPSELRTQAAWSVVGQWLAGYAGRVFDGEASLAEAEDWFLAWHPDLPRIAPQMWLDEFSRLLSPSDVFGLLPYLLDPLSPGTRRCVLKREAAWTDRRSRKTAGIYYTPADVAQYMADSVAVERARTCLDLACGSGVFLRAARSAGGALVFGCDIDPLAAERCAFVLLATDQGELRGKSPWALWHLHRLNLSTVDSLVLLPGSHRNEVGQRRRRREVRNVREALLASDTPQAASPGEPATAIGDLFPDLLEGAETLLCNPPYARLGDHPQRAKIGGLYFSFDGKAPSSAADTSTPFVEHAWQFTREGSGRAAVVVPLSVSFNTTRQFRALRHGMRAQPGGWRCAFFDRTPDALFGDDVKTRSAVLVYDAARPRGLETTGTLRWTSRTRSKFLAAIRHVDLGDLPIDGLIPKVGSEAEAQLYRGVRNLRGRLGGTALESVDRVSLVQAMEPDGGHAVFVAPTAYNWFNCARDLVAQRGGAELSSSPITRLQLAEKSLANALFAVLSSRLVYWLWRVEGDAFHVPANFLRRLPFCFDSLPHTVLDELADTGWRLWSALATEPIVSVNRGKRTLAFSPQREPKLVDEIDDLVLNAFQLSEAAREFDLTAWYERVVVVDSGDASRTARLNLRGGQAHA